MKEVMNLNITRLKMFKNYVMYQLSKTPSLISIFIIIPLILYFFGELSLSNELSYIALNSNINDLIHSFSLLFFRLLYFIIIMTAPIYILLSKIHIKSYYKYSHLNITFKTISNANNFLFFICLDLITFIVLSFILLHTSSTLSAILVFLAMFIFSLDLIVLTLSYLYQINLALISKFLNKININFLELLIVLFYTLSSISIIEKLTLEFVMNTPLYMIITVLLISFLVIKFIYNKMSFESILLINRGKKEKKVIKLKGSMSIMKNYFLLLFNIKEIYIEYIISFVILLILILNTELNMYKDMAFQFVAIFTIISNGVIYSYSKWYLMFKQEVFNKLLRIDLVFSFFLTFTISFIISFILNQKIQFPYIFYSCCTYLILNFVQRKIRLKYVNNGNTPIIFILVYGSLSFISFALLQEGYHICMRFLIG